jgi:HAD superfamily hydrolase (TIGR01509 family)
VLSSGCTNDATDTMTQLIIYDFDGVIADSEVLANSVLAQFVTELGVPTTLEDCYKLYMGKRFNELMAAVETSLGRPLPEGLSAAFQARTLERFRGELRLVAGAQQHLDAFAHLPRCIASSSSPDRLAVCLDVLELHNDFAGKVFSASAVSRGKPHPDIFLHAAERMRCEPADCIVIEDSASGVTAGIAAGMTVIGLMAASHMRPEHRQSLISAGAHFIAATFEEAGHITRRLIRSPGALPSVSAAI